MLQINRKQFTNVMMQYSFAKFPRAVGNPNQTMIYDFNALICFYKLTNGKLPVFISNNPYWDFDKYSKPTNVVYEKMFFDLDTDTGCTVEQAHNDCKQFAEYCKENNLPFASCFSGNGFHFYLFFKPKVYTLDAGLTQNIRAIANHFKEELDLKSANLVVAEPKRLVRMPLSRYATGKEIEGWTVKKNYCIPLTYDQLMNETTDSIRQLSEHPIISEESYKQNGKQIRFKDLIKEHKINIKTPIIIPKIKQYSYFDSTIDYTQVGDSDFKQMIDMLIPWKCLSKMLWMKNPPHFVRFSACAFLQNVMSKNEALSFFDKLAFDAEWNDRMNKAVRDYQISNIYQNGYIPHSCKELQKMGICVGESCVRYEKFILKNSNGKNIENGDENGNI